MTAWPSELPQSQFIGTSEEDEDAVLRTPMDAGPPTRRNKYTAHIMTVRVPIVLTGAQKAVFDTFYRTTLKNGSLSFTWDSPTDDSAMTYAFKAPVRWTLIRGGYSPATRVWQGTLELEKQP